MSSIHFNCSSCGKGLVADAAHTGWSVICPMCSTSQVVPGAAPDPSTLFQEFIGQPHIKERLGIAIEASGRREETLPHILLVGPNGMGKVKLAYTVSRLMGVNLVATSANQVRRTVDLAGLLANLGARDVLLIEEIERIRASVRECLLPALRDFSLNFVVDEGDISKPIHVDLPPYTLVGTTTRIQRMPGSMLSCFPITLEFAEYTAEELAGIGQRLASDLGLQLDPAAAEELARHSDGTPRGILNLLHHLRDYALVKSASTTITAELVAAALRA